MTQEDAERIREVDRQMVEAMHPMPVAPLDPEWQSKYRDYLQGKLPERPPISKREWLHFHAPSIGPDGKPIGHSLGKRDRATVEQITVNRDGDSIRAILHVSFQHPLDHKALFKWVSVRFGGFYHHGMAGWCDLDFDGPGEHLELEHRVTVSPLQAAPAHGDVWIGKTILVNGRAAVIEITEETLRGPWGQLARESEAIEHRTWTCSHCGFTCPANGFGGPDQYHDCKDGTAP